MGGFLLLTKIYFTGKEGEREEEKVYCGLFQAVCVASRCILTLNVSCLQGVLSLLRAICDRVLNVIVVECKYYLRL